MKNETWSTYRQARSGHWEKVHAGKSRSAGKYYHRYLQRVYGFIIPKGSKVLELGCGSGDLLASLKPSCGFGIDFAPGAIQKARLRHPDLRFELQDAGSIELDAGQFDFIILSDLVNDLYDVQSVLERLRAYCHSRTCIVINFHSQLWKPPLRLAQKLGLATPLLAQNWLTVSDLRTLFTLSGFEILRKWSEFVVPVWFPGVNWFNRYPGKVFPFRWLALTNFIVGRPTDFGINRNPSCSIIIPARNEEGHVEELFQRIPEMGTKTEIIFVEGNSMDDTYGAIEHAIQNHPERSCLLLKQPGKGKGDAVRAGFAAATGDVLMILDADMTVCPEDLARFYNAIATGKGQFMNGVRLVYPMEEKAMRFVNLLGNKFFAAAFTWLLGQPVRDTLCGTKVMWRTDYERLAANRDYFGDFDPFGDFDLLFGAAKLNLKIMELPVRYQSRRYGNTNISRWSHGFLLLRMVLVAAHKLKFF